MDCYFTTSHGDTLHNNPGTKDYVAGEPPINSSSRMINYRIECLVKGFARVGWPNTGDLRPDHFGESRLAPEGYSFSSLSKSQRNCLENFSKILAGDLIIIPADEETGVVHLGIVLTKDHQFILPYIDPRPSAYFYFYDIPNGDYYECAHRVNVKWAKGENNEFMTFHVKGLSGIWRNPFSRVLQQKETIIQFARKVKLF